MFKEHHIYKRRRINKNLIKTFDKFLFIIAVLGPLMTLPQLIKIYTLKNAAGVSAISWGLYAVLDIPWIIYGFIHKEKLLVFSYFLWIITNTAVTIGAIIY